MKKPLLYKRKEPKKHGMKQMIEGNFEPGKRALIIEDVVTSGSSILETVEVIFCFNFNKFFKDLRHVELVCEDAICVLNRQQGGTESLRSKNITLKRYIF